ncbi:non-canonical purine NTP pyrophosphatase [Mucisphaera calidilacus]|uniref:Non-canonical purine NTP pyrophosphatase n=1 Tax=Mucisphaera calidilacus TaxID=2527982 RepID=A0A518C059_9BACT|nr:non-canonical purine NTP pyrophosphatase [Mucisphaera calidilacus]QDU72599.1 Non-canonical purine NTP pyrophosphatase [Mucisphaera calidilacus]
MNDPHPILIATGNPHKVDEIAAALAGYLEGITLHSLRDLDRDIPEPVEDRNSFTGNAAVKAVEYARATGMTCLADDSGLVVDALDGHPGVDSAHYADDQPDLPAPWDQLNRAQRDPANNRKLLHALDGVHKRDRHARFVCHMVIAAPTPAAKPLTDLADIPDDLRPHCLATVVGRVEGRILLPEEADNPEQPHLGKGTNGFGYDPLFLLDEDAPYPGLTTAQLTPDEKNAISHRGRACAKLIAFNILQSL